MVEIVLIINRYIVRLNIHFFYLFIIDQNYRQSFFDYLLLIIQLMLLIVNLYCIVPT